jgi:hypothetical protein
MNCPNCNKAVQSDWQSCPYCQIQLGIENDASQQNPFSAPSSQPELAQIVDDPQQGDATGGVIPYKNPKALIAYYLGIVSGIPIIGLPFGIAAFVLGILGLRDRKRNPVIKGAAHAWIGIGCGGIFMLFWGAVIVIAIIATIAG